MKKSIKILALVLSLALICGAIVIAAFAADDDEITGVTTHYDIDFEKETINPADDVNGYPEGMLPQRVSNPLHPNVILGGEKNWDDNNRYGYGSIKAISGTNRYDEGNQYFSYIDDNTLGTPATGGGAYLNFGINSVMTTSNYIVTDGVYTGNNFAGNASNTIYVADIDVRTPTGDFPGASIGLFPYAMQTDNAQTPTVKANIVASVNVNVSLSKDSTGAYVVFNSEKYYVDNNEWTHITLIAKTDVATDGNGDYLSITFYVYVNGQLLSSTVKDTSSGIVSGANTFYHGDRTAVMFRQVRVNCGSSNTQGKSIDVDNVYVRSYDMDAYKGGLTAVLGEQDITTWAGNRYNKANMPIGNVLVTNTTKNVAYDNVQFAVDQASAGDVLTLNADSTIGAEIGKQLTIQTNGYTTPLAGTNGYAMSYDSATGAYTTVEIASAVGFFYVNADGVSLFTTDLSTALTGAKSGSAVELTGDLAVTPSANITPTSNITLNLGGNSLTVWQKPSESNAAKSMCIELNGTTLTVKNGTINTAVISGSHKDKSYPLFDLKGAASLTLDGVNSNVSSLIMSNTSGATPTVTVNGGTHTLTRVTGGVMGGFVSSYNGAVMTFNATNAYFYADNDSFVVGHGGAAASTFNFFDCTLVQSVDETSGLIRFGTTSLAANFYNCDIYGNISPRVSGLTGASGTAATAANIVFSAGTSFNSTKTVKYTVANGTETAGAGTIAFNASVSNNTPATDGAFTFTPTAVSVTTDKYISATGYRYITGGVVTYTDDLATAINGADNGTVIYMLSDMKHSYNDNTSDASFTAYATVSGKEITLDLGGHLLVVCSYRESIHVSTNGTFNVKNGQIATYSEAYASNASYPFVELKGTNPTLNLYNVDTFGTFATNAWSDATNTKVYVEGGYHGITIGTMHIQNSFVVFRYGGNLVAKDAFFYMEDGGNSLISQWSRSNNTKSASFYFDNCKIIGTPGQSVNIVKMANSYANIEFHNCDISGNINPTQHGSDTNKTAIPLNQIRLTGNTRWIATGNTLNVTHDTNNVYKFLGGEDFTILKISDTPKTDGIVPTENNVSVSFDNVIGDVSGYKSITYDDVTYYYNYSEGFLYEAGGTLVYTDNIATAATRVDAGGEIILLADYEYVSSAAAAGFVFSATKNMTLNLNSYSFTIKQNHQFAIGVSAGVEFTAKNGTMYCVWANTDYANRAFAMIRVLGDGATVNLDNVDTYCSVAVTSNFKDLTLNITGGEHHAIYTAVHTWGGYIEARNEITFTATNTTFFVDRNSWLVTSASRYGSNANNPDKSTLENSFTFDNCKLISDPDDRGDGFLIRYANENTSISFVNNCVILGAISPILRNEDVLWDSSTGAYGSTKYGTIGAGAITFGEGTKFVALGETVNLIKSGVITLADGANIFYEENNETVRIADCNDEPITDGSFILKEKDVALETIFTVKTDSSLNYRITAKGLECYSTNIADAIRKPDANTTVYMLKDMTETYSTQGFSYLNKTLTLDLGGHLLNIVQHDLTPDVSDNSGQACITIGGSANLTVKNGAIRNVQDNGSYMGYSYPLFSIQSNAKLTLNGVDTYSGAIAYGFDAPNVTFTVIGGVHHVFHGSMGNEFTGWFYNRANATFTASGATFLVDGSKNNAYIFSSSHIRETGTANSTFTFTNCKLIDISGGDHIMRFANSATYIAFNNCEIYGGINTSVRADDTVSAAMPLTNVTFSQGTKIAGNSAFLGDTFANQALTLSGSGMAKMFEDNSTTVNYTPYGGEATSFTANYTIIINSAEGFTYSYEKGGNLYYTSDLAEAISNVSSGGTITFLADVVIETSTTNGDHIARIYKDITFDLKDHSLTIKQYERNAICISTNADVTVKDGTIYSAWFGATYQDKNFSTFLLAGNNANLTLDNVNTYGGSIVSQVNTYTNTHVTVNGGNHHLIYANVHTWGGFIETRHAITFEATDANFFIDSNGALISAASYYSKVDNAKDAPEGRFTFNNCKIIADPDDMGGSVIRNANEKTKIYFNDGCYISASIATSSPANAVNSSDKLWDSATSGYSTTKYQPIQPGAIVFSRDTRFNITGNTQTYISEGIIVFEDGYTLVPDEEILAFEVTDCTDTPATGGLGFTLDATDTLNITFAYVVADGSEYLFAYKSGGIWYRVPDFETAMSLVPNNGSVIFYTDYTLVGTPGPTQTPVLTVNKNVTVDLNGYTLSIDQYWQNPIYFSKELTIKNGTMTAIRHDEGYIDGSFAMFQVSGNGPTLTLENVNTYSGSLVYNYDKASCTVNIIGGEHYGIYAGRGTGGGLIESRNGMTFTATNALFFVDRDSFIINSSSYTGHWADAASVTTRNNFTFTGCTLIADPEDGNGSYTLFKHANQFTTITLNACNVYGSIATTVRSNDFTYDSEAKKYTTTPFGAMPASNLIIGEGTRFATNIGDISIELPGYTISGDFGMVNDTQIITFTVSDGNDNPGVEGVFFIQKRTVECTFNLLVGKDEITITYHYPDGTTSTVVVSKGDKITEFAEYEKPEPVLNGWVHIIYDGGWSTTRFGTKVDSITVGDNRIHLYPSTSLARAYMIGAQFNLSLYGNVRVNLYLDDDKSMPSEVSLVGVFDSDGNRIRVYEEGIALYGKTFNRYEGSAVNALSLADGAVTTVMFYYDGVLFTQRITITPTDYIKRVMAHEKTSDAALNVLSDLVIYANALQTYSTGGQTNVYDAFNEEFTLADGSTSTILEVANQHKSTLVGTDAFDSVTNDEGAFAEYIRSITVNLGSSDPNFVITFVENKRIADVQIIMHNAWSGNTEDARKGTISYGSTPIGTYTEDGYTFCNSVASDAISIYNFGCTFTIKLTVRGDLGGKYVVALDGSYNLNNYYNGIEADGEYTAEDIARAQAALVAMRTYANTAAQYRFGQNADFGTGLDDIDESDVYSVYYMGDPANNTQNKFYFGAQGDYNTVVNDGFDADTLEIDATDDFAAIQAAHAFANKLKDEGKNVTVYAYDSESYVGTAPTFYIKNTDMDAETFCTSIEIRTNTKWLDSGFVIDDTDIVAYYTDEYGVNHTIKDAEHYNKDTTYTVDGTEYAMLRNEAFVVPVFMVKQDKVDYRDDTAGDWYTKLSFNAKEIAKGDSYVFEEVVKLDLPFETALVYIQAENHHHYIRYGANQGATRQYEILLVDTKTGKIDPSTPITYDYMDASYIRVYNADEDAINIDGGSFTTLYNQINSYNYCSRGIRFTRSNASLTNFSNDFIYSSWNLTFNYNSSNEWVGGGDGARTENGSPMAGLIDVSETHGVTIDNAVLEGPQRFYSVRTVQANRGSYSIRANKNSSLTISNVDQSNFYTDTERDGDGYVDHKAFMGSNFCKNFYFINNRVNTFDSHTGLHNLYVKNCEVERINGIGTGTIWVEDTIIHTQNTHAAITLREDYGSEFNGDVYFKNVTLEAYDSDYVALFLIGYYNYGTGLYYTSDWTDSSGTHENSYYEQDTDKSGDNSRYYASYMPQNVYIDGITILSGGSVTANASQELGGTYKKGAATTSLSFGLVTSYTSNRAFHDAIRTGDISTVGATYKTGGKWCANSWTDSTIVYKNYETVTVNHAIKGTSNVYVGTANGGLNDNYLNEYTCTQDNYSSTGLISSGTSVYAGDVQFLDYTTGVWNG